MCPREGSAKAGPIGVIGHRSRYQNTVCAGTFKDRRTCYGSETINAHRNVGARLSRFGEVGAWYTGQCVGSNTTRPLSTIARMTTLNCGSPYAAGGDGDGPGESRGWLLVQPSVAWRFGQEARITLGDTAIANQART